VRAGELVGGELLLVQDGRVVLHEGFGWRDRERRVPFRRDTICRLGSLTKPIVATCVLILVAEGRLGPDEAVARHIPAFRGPRSRGITVQQLLTHTGGLGDYPRGPREYASLEAMVNDIGTRGPAHPVGEQYRYSNAGAATLAYLVAVVSGLPVEEFMRRRIFQPLGMGDTFCGAVPRDRLARTSSVYRWEEGRFVKTWDPVSSTATPYFHGAGGLYSTARDYARFLAAWMGRGPEGKPSLLSERMRRLALTPTPLRPDYAWLWYVDPATGGENRLPEFGHGSLDGARAWVMPAEEAMFLYFIQCGGPTPARIHTLAKDALRRALLQGASRSRFAGPNR
jgi:CubicO group peptidase (beta-lactamase class C family)